MLIFVNLLTINVTPFPARLSASNLVNCESRYGMCPERFFVSLSDAMQYPLTKNETNKFK